MIVDSLRYWVETMHVDGFRFDLASVLSRDASGDPMPNAPVLWDIESDPVLAGTKLIAEAWDAAGLYQVGSFVGDSWQEWNGRFRDDVRSFFRGEQGTVTRVADRLIGSPEIYAHKEREAEQSVNYVTCHDGFTLNDLVSYDGKHNVTTEQGILSHHRRDAHRAWHGVKLHQPDWRDFSHSLALSAEIPGERLVVHVILNAYSEPLDFELPSGDEAAGPWHRWIDT